MASEQSIYRFGFATRVKNLTLCCQAHFNSLNGIRVFFGLFSSLHDFDIDTPAKDIRRFSSLAFVGIDAVSIGNKFHCNGGAEQIISV